MSFDHHLRLPMKKEFGLIIFAILFIAVIQMTRADAYQATTNKQMSLTIEVNDPSNRFGTTNKNYRYSDADTSILLGTQDQNNDGGN